MTSQRAIILLSGCLGICLFALGFLLGRESNRAPATVVSALAAQVVAAPDPVPAAPTAVSTEAPSEAMAPTPAPRVSPAAVSRAAGASAPTRSSPAVSDTTSRPIALPRAADGSADKQAVARYFSEVDRLQNVDVDNPEATATALIGAATSGDSSGLRQLVSKARDSEQKVRAITPPPPCAHYHEQLVNMLAESHSMLRRLEQGIGSGDVESLQAMASQANTAKSRSERLDSEARELKRRYGIVP